MSLDELISMYHGREMDPETYIQYIVFKKTMEFIYLRNEEVLVKKKVLRAYLLELKMQVQNLVLNLLKLVG